MRRPLLELAPFCLSMLFELCDEVHDLADYGIFEPRRVADSAGESYLRRRQPTPFPFQPPLLCRCRQFVDCAAEIGGIAGALRHGTEARQDSVAEIFVDAAVV